MSSMNGERRCSSPCHRPRSDSLSCITNASAHPQLSWNSTTVTSKGSVDSGSGMIVTMSDFPAQPSAYMPTDINTRAISLHAQIEALVLSAQ